MIGFSVFNRPYFGKRSCSSSSYQKVATPWKTWTYIADFMGQVEGNYLGTNISPFIQAFWVDDFPKIQVEPKAQQINPAIFWKKSWPWNPIIWTAWDAIFLDRMFFFGFRNWHRMVSDFNHCDTCRELGNPNRRVLQCITAMFMKKNRKTNLMCQRFCLNRLPASRREDYIYLCTYLYMHALISKKMHLFQKSW